MFKLEEWADYEKYKNLPILKQFHFEILVPPMIVESSTSNDMVVREGSNVTLICKAKGYPEPYVSDLHEIFRIFRKFWFLHASIQHSFRP